MSSAASYKSRDVSIYVEVDGSLRLYSHEALNSTIPSDTSRMIAEAILDQDQEKDLASPKKTSGRVPRKKDRERGG